MILTAPFRLTTDFLTAFGYRGGRRFVALFWEPSGDEACYDDGRTYACGSANNWLYLDFVRQPQVKAWLVTNDLRTGDSEEAAHHWLIVDAVTGMSLPPTARKPVRSSCAKRSLSN